MLDVNGARGAAYRSNSAPNLQLLHLHKQLHHPHINDWMDVVMAAEGTPVTLPCSDEPSSLAERVTWMVMRSEEKQWTSLLSVNTSRGLVDQTVSRARGRTFEIFEDVSLQFTATATDGGRYSCLLQQTGRKLKERIILLALFKLTLTPAPSVPVNSTVRLIAQVSPSYAIAGGMWLSPAGVPLLTAYSAGTLLTKLPRVSQADNGIYTCSIHAYGQSSKPEHNHTLTLNVNVPTVSKASLSSSEVTLPCPEVKGDFVRLYWWAPDKVMEPKMVFQFDRWRNHTEKRKSVLQLLGSSSSSSADGGVFSFLLKAALGDAGRYQCEVFLDDSVQCQSTTLTILHGSTRSSSSSLDLRCRYAERSNIKSVSLRHIQRPNLQLSMTAKIGNVIAHQIPLPVTPETSGQYVCILQLKNLQTIRYVFSVPLLPKERPCCVSEGFTTDSSHSPGSLLTPAGGSSVSEQSAHLLSLSLLLFLLPVVATGVGVLLRIRGCCSSRRNVNVEQTLSYYSGEVENIYEDPEDLRQSPSHAAVYMDLKPTGDTDVYKELDRYDPCCG
ncbi:g6f-like isoform X2 [Hoplias malabaricus]|uniref:g6f-like isoform X2 n=1 Tax=Hoplias malabaricus TaxID=27720 RepID=UPI003462FC92